MRRIFKLPGLRDCAVNLSDAGLYFGPDTHMFALGRLVQPDLLTLLDIGECQCLRNLRSSESDSESESVNFKLK
jgi:hypothetical protein